MRNSRFLVLGAVALLSAFAFSQKVTGSWKGHVDLSDYKLPAEMPAEQKAMVEKQLAQAKAIVFNLNVNANKTYKLTTKGYGPSHSGEGTWTQSGSSITLTAKKQDGKAVAASTVGLTLKLSKDGKTFTLVPPPGSPSQGKLVFVR